MWYYLSKKRLGIAAAIIVVGIAASCSKENEETLKAQQGPVVCDTTGMQYSTDVLPILQTNCYRCHGNGIVTGGVTLDGYANLHARVVNGDLVGAITHAAGYTPMPFDGGKLSDCDIAKIRAWINEGAPDN